MRIDLFLNDSYKILNLLYENQTVVLDKKVVPLTQSEIANELGNVKGESEFSDWTITKRGICFTGNKGKVCAFRKSNFTN